MHKRKKKRTSKTDTNIYFYNFYKLQLIFKLKKYMVTLQNIKHFKLIGEYYLGISFIILAIT